MNGSVVPLNPTARAWSPLPPSRESCKGPRSIPTSGKDGHIQLWEGQPDLDQGF